MVRRRYGQPSAKRVRLDTAGSVQLPFDVLENIFINLSPTDIPNISLVSKHWNTTLQDDILWKRLLLRHFDVLEPPSKPQFSSWKNDYMNFFTFQYGTSYKRLEDCEARSFKFSDSGRYMVGYSETELSVWDVERNFSLLKKLSSKYYNTRSRVPSVLNDIDMTTTTVLFDENDEKLLVEGSKRGWTYEDIGCRTIILIFSIPSLDIWRRLTFDSGSPLYDGLRFFGTIEWFGLNSFHANVDHDNQEHLGFICATDPGEEPITLYHSDYDDHEIVNNTITGQKHLVSIRGVNWDYDWPHSFSCIRSVAIIGSVPDPLHSCSRCADSPGRSCLRGDYSTTRVSDFSEDRTLRNRAPLNGCPMYFIAGKMDDKVFVVLQKSSNVCLVEYTLDLTLVRSVSFPIAPPAIYNQFCRILPVSGNRFYADARYDGKRILYDSHYKVFLERKRKRPLHNTTIQMSQHRWIVANRGPDRTGIICYHL